MRLAVVVVANLPGCDWGCWRTTRPHGPLVGAVACRGRTEVFYMRCPFCKEINQDKVIDSRLSEGGEVIRRRRMCMKCKKRFTTKERAENEIRVTVIKRDGTRVPYDRGKILRGLERACWKRPIDDVMLEQVVDRVEDMIFRNNEREVSSQYIGLLIGDELRKLDQIAYVRFASVYRRFEALGELITEAQDVIDRSATHAPGQQQLFE